MPLPPADPVVGIDVGAAKGYHAVGLVNSKISTYQAQSPQDIKAWCREFGARAIAIDAPCRWSTTGQARTAERQLMAKKIWCFSTPSRNVAIAHPTQHYGWMLSGEALYEALATDWRLYSGASKGESIVLETFPHAVMCSLAGKPVPAKGKARTRREALTSWGLDIRKLRNIDFVDAGLCAVTAALFRCGCTVEFGDIESGFIVVPDSSS